MKLTRSTKILTALAAAGIVMGTATAAFAINTSGTGYIYGDWYIQGISPSYYVVPVMNYDTRVKYTFKLAEDTRIYSCGRVGISDGTLINGNNLDKIQESSGTKGKIRVNIWDTTRDTITCV